MEVKIKTFDELTTKELYEILKLRADVFVVEQNGIYPDLDNIDYRSIHIFYENEDETIAAYLRFFKKEGENDTVQIGRVVTSKRMRGTGLGGRLLGEGIKAAEKMMNPQEMCLSAQTYATGFYAREGFEITSEEYLEDGIPHMEMRRRK